MEDRCKEGAQQLAGAHLMKEERAIQVDDEDPNSPKSVRKTLPQTNDLRKSKKHCDFDMT